MQKVLFGYKLRKLNWLARIVIAVVFGLVAMNAPVVAALYTDTFSATIIAVTHAGSGYNPYGLADGMNFNWAMTFDTNTLIGSSISFSQFYPANQLSFAIPKSGYPPQILTEEMDYSYPYGGQFDGAYGYFSPGGFNTSSSRLENLYYGGDNGVCTLNFYTDAAIFELFFSISNASWSLFTFDPGLTRFDPGTDRTTAPIPGTLFLLGSGMVALVILQRRR
jgi:hypothetical protein